jgi:hypothetical protein
MQPDKLVSHYERAGYDVLAITDHWARTDEPSSTGCSSLRAGSRTPGRVPVHPEVHVLALGITTQTALPSGDCPDGRGCRRLDSRARGRPRHRPRLLERLCAPSNSTPAACSRRSRSGTLEATRRRDEALGRGDPAPRDRDRRPAPSRPRQRVRLGLREGDRAGSHHGGRRRRWPARLDERPLGPSDRGAGLPPARAPELGAPARRGIDARAQTAAGACRLDVDPRAPTEPSSLRLTTQARAESVGSDPLSG